MLVRLPSGSPRGLAWAEQSSRKWHTSRNQMEAHCSNKHPGSCSGSSTLRPSSQRFESQRVAHC